MALRIYTRTGDDGTTGLIGGQRVAKDNLRVAAYGTVDELNALLGVARAEAPPADLDQVLARIQDQLFVLGCGLATPPDKEAPTPRIETAGVETLERDIDRFEAELPPLSNFILPGGSRTAAALHHARTVCRRAERELVALGRLQEVGREALVYLNRLSDLLFVMARLANHRAGCAEILWRGGSVESEPSR